MMLRTGQGTSQSDSKEIPLLLLESGETSIKTISVQLNCLVENLSVAQFERHDQVTEPHISGLLQSGISQTVIHGNVYRSP